MRWPFVSRSERLRREASDWIARLNGPHEAAEREAFGRWYAAHPDHARTYDRIAALFAAAGEARRPVAGGTARPVRRPMRLRLAMVAGALAAAIAAVFLLSGRTALTAPGAGASATYASRDDFERLTLADGSEVVLSSRSALEVSFDGGQRLLRLTRGEASFSVAHEQRPFIVEAGRARVIARGTRFVVRLADGNTAVTLLQGAVDVAYAPPGDGAASPARVTRLRSGQSLVMGPAPGADPPAQGDAAEAMVAFDGMPLAAALGRIGGGRQPAIRLGEPSLGELRVTGAFPAGDSRGFARSVAVAFGLRLETSADGTIWLRSPRAGPRTP